MRTGNAPLRRLFVTIIAAGITIPALGQNGRPLPAEPKPAAPAPGAVSSAAEALPFRETLGRRPMPRDKFKLAVKDAPVEQMVEFIAETTGKVVIPIKIQQLKGQKITVFTDEPIDRATALDRIFEALRVNDIGVIETEDKIFIGTVDEILRLKSLDVLGPNDDIMGRDDLANFVVKIFRLKEAQADSLGENLQNHIPDYATLTIDATSNQIVVVADISTLKHLQLLINELDHVKIPVETKTYRLRYADAQEIADNIYELFDISTTAAATRTPGRAPQRSARTPRGGRNAAQPAAASAAAPNPLTGEPGPTVEMRLTVNQQQNTVTAQADPAVVRQIDELVYEFWDLPRPEGTSKAYHLRYTDPLRVRDMLQTLLDSSGGGTRRAASRGGAGGAAAAGGAGARTGEGSMGGIYRIEAYPDSQSLVVLCKTEESFGFLDSIVENLDQPSTVGIPFLMELKHADAVSLADELNVLLSEAGTNITLERPGSGLSEAQSVSDAGAGAGAASGGSGSTGGASGGSGGRSASAGGEIRFPWMAAGRAREDQSPESSLIGKIRVVPILRQNALSVLAPGPYQEPVRELIALLDRPGRQVMISAIIAEVELTDDFALGMRVSRTDIPLTKVDNSLGGSVGAAGTKDPIFGSTFTTSVLDLDFNANWALQALAEKTNVKVLQEPRVFTADNQEAVFFDGQDIPFITDSFTNNTGGLTQGFEYRQVGVVLNVRPRITAERDVDMEVYLELSNIVPGQTLFGGFIVDRRSTTTQVVVKNGQTIVISGILNDTESKITRKVPLLGDIPFLGGLFSSTESQKVTTELVAFITPIVVEHPSENDINYNRDYREGLLRLREPMEKLNMEMDRAGIRDRIVRPKVVTPPSDDSSSRSDAPKSPAAPQDSRTVVPTAQPLTDPDDLVPHSP